MLFTYANNAQIIWCAELSSSHHAIFIITWWRTLKISIPQGDKTLHFDTIWILKGKNAAQVDFFFARFQCRLRDAVCEIVKIVVC
jgi:predicted secreted protein